MTGGFDADVPWPYPGVQNPGCRTALDPAPSTPARPARTPVAFPVWSRSARASGARRLPARTPVYGALSAYRRLFSARIQIGYGRQPRQGSRSAAARKDASSPRARASRSASTFDASTSAVCAARTASASRHSCMAASYSARSAVSIWRYSAALAAGGGDVRRVRVQGRIGGGGVAEVRL